MKFDPNPVKAVAEYRLIGYGTWMLAREELRSFSCRSRVQRENMSAMMADHPINSPNVRREIEYALGAKRYSNRLIPVAVGDRARFPTREIPWIVRQLPWVELHDREGGDPDVEPIADTVRGRA